MNNSNCYPLLFKRIVQYYFYYKMLNKRFLKDHVTLEIQLFITGINETHIHTLKQKTFILNCNIL